MDYISFEEYWWLRVLDYYKLMNIFYRIGCLVYNIIDVLYIYRLKIKFKI